MANRISKFILTFVAVVSLFLSAVPLRAATSNHQADVLQTSQGPLRIQPLYQAA